MDKITELEQRLLEAERARDEAEERFVAVRGTGGIPPAYMGKLLATYDEYRCCQMKVDSLTQKLNYLYGVAYGEVPW